MITAAVQEESPNSPGWLVAQAQKGNAEAFAKLVDLVQARLRRAVVFWCYRIRCCENAEYADDIVQDTLLKAYEHLGDFRGDANFATWATRIAINECLLMRRRRQREGRFAVSLDAPVETEKGAVQFDIRAQDESPEQQCARTELASAVQRAVRRLKEPYRTVLIMCDLHGVSPAGAARLLGISVSGVKSRLLRARRELRGTLAYDLRIPQPADPRR